MAKGTWFVQHAAGCVYCNPGKPYGLNGGGGDTGAKALVGIGGGVTYGGNSGCGGGGSGDGGLVWRRNVGENGGEGGGKSLEASSLTVSRAVSSMKTVDSTGLLCKD